MASSRTRTTPTLGADPPPTRSAHLHDFVDVDGDDVIDAARRGDQAAWEQIYRRLGPPLTRYAASRGIADAEDVTQEVMSTAAEQIHRFTGGWENLRSWLFTIAYRRCADHHRRRHRNPEAPTDLPPEHIQPHSSADTDLWADGDAREALAALDILNERERDVVTLRVIGELGTRDVADALGLSRTNVRVIQSRALAKMRRHLEGNGGFLDKRFRSAPAPTAIALEMMRLLERLRDMGEPLPAEGRLGAWVEALRTRSPEPPPDLATTAAGLADVASQGTSAGIATATGLPHTLAVVAVTAAVVGGVVAAPPPEEATSQETPDPRAPVGHLTASTGPLGHQATPSTKGWAAIEPDGFRPGLITLDDQAILSDGIVSSSAFGVSSHVDELGGSVNLSAPTDVAQLGRLTDQLAEATDGNSLDDVDETVQGDVAVTAGEHSLVDAGLIESDVDENPGIDEGRDTTTEAATEPVEETVSDSDEEPLDFLGD